MSRHDDKDAGRGKKKTMLSGASPQVTTEANLLVPIDTYTSKYTDGENPDVKGLAI